jgi:predicted nucleic acid-binding protein
MLYYLDSSAWVKRYFKEAGREWVNGLFDQYEVLACSPLGFIEVGSTMARKRSAGEVTPEEFGPKRAALLKDWRRLLRMDMTAAVVQRAFEVGDPYSLRGADSVHLASALVLKEELDLGTDELAFVTSDAELKAAAVKAGLTVIDPQEEEAKRSAHPTP